MIAPAAENNNRITIYFDGQCQICTREIERYRKMDKEGKLRFISFADKDFDASAHGLDKGRLEKAMHVRDTDGRIYTGVEGFGVIWKAFPNCKILNTLLLNPMIKPFSKLGYLIFARLRRYLPKRDVCTDHHCDLK